MSNKVDYLFDCRMLRSSGIGTYLQALLPRLGQRLSGTAVAICHGSDANLLEQWGYSPCVRETGIYSPQESLLGWRHLPKSGVYWVPHFNVPLLAPRYGRLLVTVHDLFHRDQAFRIPYAQQLYSRMLLRNAHMRADKIIAVSAFTQSRIAHYYPDFAHKVQVIHNGGPQLATENVTTIPALVVGKKYVLMVGNVKPHKNIAGAIAAFREFRKNHGDIDLVIVGNYQGMQNAESIESFSAPFIHFTGFVSADELAGYYRNCEFFLFPSLYEGFGLPVLEAAANGAVICCSRIPPVEEIAHPSCVFFDPHNTQAMVEAMEVALRTAPITQEERQKWLGQYQWEHCAMRHYEAIHAIG